MGNNKEQPNSLQVSENKKLSIPQPNNILTDIYGVITSWDFKQQLNNYFRNSLQEYLKTNFKEKTITMIINKLREDSIVDMRAGIQIPLIENVNKSEDEIVNSVVANILWRIDKNHDPSHKSLNTLRDNMWKDAYKTSKLQVHVFSDVKRNLEEWRLHRFIKIYTYASGTETGQKLFMSSTVEGDLTKFLANHINASGGSKYDPNKYRVIISSLREPNPKNILYLTDDPTKARAAIEAGLRAVLVIRPENTVYRPEEYSDLMTITSFDDLVFEEIPGNPVPCC